MEPKNLYKLDSKGKTRILIYWTKGSLICQSSGLLNGALVENKKEAIPKNVGRANETTPEEQAILEVESTIRKKINEGYCETIEECQASTLILPMLAQELKKQKSINWARAYAQRKFDGQRILAEKVGSHITLMSRGGKEVLTLDHIKREMVALSLPDGIYDGEAYNRELGSIQQQMKAIKKERETTKLIQLHIYDIVSPLPFEARHDYLKNVIDDSNPTIKLVETIKIGSKNELNELHAQFMEEGYEGSMVRISEKGYEPDARSSQLLKNKDFIDMKLCIKDVIPEDDRPAQGKFIFDWEGATNHPAGDNILGCIMKFSHKEREEFLLNKQNYIGREVELRFFLYSEEGVPRHPVAVLIF